MKVKDSCAHCGKHARKVTITIKDEDRDKFLAFTALTQQAGHPGVIPPSKYPRHPLVIPAPGQNPCGLCKFGEESAGPSGCGRGKTCLAYAYYQLHQLDKTTNNDATTALKEFTCAVPTASWSFPTRKRSSARSAALPSILKPETSSARAGSSGKRASPKSKWRKQSKLPSKRTSR